MNENTPSSVQWNDNPNGTVTFATDVVAKMANLAATEVEGVASMTTGNSTIADIFTRRTQNFTKGVKIAIENNRVLVDVSIVVEYGNPVPDVAKGIQENVKKAIETMSGLDVQSVDVHVLGVSFEKENKAALEPEARQQRMLEEQQQQHSSEAQGEPPRADGEGEETPEEDLEIAEEFPDAPEPAGDEEIEVEVEDDAEPGKGDAL